MIESRLTKKILNALLKNGADFSEIFIQKRVSSNLRLEDSKIDNSSSGYELGCGLRLWIGDSTFYAYVDSIQHEKLLDAATVLSSAVNGSSSLKVLDLTRAESSYRTDIEKFPDSVSQDTKKKILESVDRTSRDFSPSIIQVTSNLSDVAEEIYIANSRGVLSHEESVKTFLGINAVAKKKKEVRTGYQSLARTSGYEMFDIKSPGNAALKASEIAVKMLDAVGAPAGELPAVIGPAFGGVIFHEACGHGLEADAVMKDATVFKGKIGKKIASDVVTAVDDSTLHYLWGSYKFDGDGYPSSETVLIKD